MKHVIKNIAVVLAAGATLGFSVWAQALEIKPFKAEELAAAQSAGKPVAVLFHADWCPTCKQQEQSLEKLKSQAGLDVLVLIADYDKEKDLKRALKVRSQSVLLVFRGQEEKARLGGETSVEKISTALKSAL